MQTSKFFTLALIAGTAVFSSGAFANDSDYPGVQAGATASTVTRAQVRAEYLQAKREGTLPHDDNSYPVVVADDSAKTRAEVKQELAEAQRGGYTPRIDNSYPSEQAGS
jgi:hypothetical protein